MPGKTIEGLRHLRELMNPEHRDSYFRGASSIIKGYREGSDHLRTNAFPVVDPDKMPVVLLGGFWSRPELSYDLGRELKALGHRVKIPPPCNAAIPGLDPLIPNTGDLRKYGDFIGRRIEEMSDKKILAVAHSLAGEALLYNIATSVRHKIAGVVAISSPLQGTPLAYVGRVIPKQLWRLPSQISPGSKLVRNLKHYHHRVTMTLRSGNDPFVPSENQKSHSAKTRDHFEPHFGHLTYIQEAADLTASLIDEVYREISSSVLAEATQYISN